MYHTLFAGHFAFTGPHGYMSIVNPLDMTCVSNLAREFGFERDGEVFTIDDDIMTVHDGFIECPWLMAGGTNRKSLKFLLRLHELTNCTIVAHGQGPAIGVEELLQIMGAADARG